MDQSLIGEWLEEATAYFMAERGWDFEKSLDAASFMLVYELGVAKGRKEALGPSKNVPKPID
jgi:hypothetical protein